MASLKFFHGQRVMLRSYHRRMFEYSCRRLIQSTGKDGTPSRAISTQPDLEVEKDRFGHPRLPHRGHFEEDKCGERREWASKFTGAKLDYIGDWWPVNGRRTKEVEDKLPTTMLKGNIENPIGVLTVPVCAAGPLRIRGRHVSSLVIVPYATTERGVVAAATRGSSTLNLCGGAVVRVTAGHQRRSPLFLFSNVVEAAAFAKWIEGQVPRLRESMKDVSRHGQLQKIQVFHLGRKVRVCFFYSTADAAGQNMVTAMTNNAYKWISRTVKEELKDQVTVKFQMIDDTFSGDKHGSWLSSVIGRGLSVHADAYIPNSVLESELKVSADRLQRAFDVCSQSLIESGAAGTNIAFADCISAIFTATGQDIACITECSSHSSLSVRTASSSEVDHAKEQLRHQSKASNEADASSAVSEGGVYISMSIPSLSIGTVGGGTMLPTQKECLSMMGCLGMGGARRLAEIIAASGLALDLSALASIASGHHMYSLEEPIHDKLLQHPV